MKNLKKVLSLVLALAMALSLMTVAFAKDAADFADYDEINYKEAVDVMVAAGVFNGTGDGSNFDADADLTREQAAKIVTYMLMGKEKADKLTTTVAPYADVAADRWSAGAIAYCTNEGILAGAGNGYFNPTGKLDGLAFSKMLLTALGYDAEIEKLTGSTWAINTAKLAIAAELDNDMEEVSLSSVLTREQAALMAFNTMKADMVRYANKGTVIVTGDGTTVVVGASEATKVVNEDSDYQDDDEDDVLQFVEKYFEDLTVVNEDPDAFGRPAYSWDNDGTTVTTVSETPVATFTAETDADDVAKALKGYKLANNQTGDNYKTYKIENTTVYQTANVPADKVNANATADFDTNAIFAINGKDNTVSLGAGNEDGNETTAAAIADCTANGRLIELYADDDKVITAGILVNYTLGEVTKISTDKKTGDVSYTITNAGGVKKDYADEDKDDTIVLAADVEKDDVVTLVTIDGTTYVYPTTNFTGAQTSFNTKDETILVGGETYTVATGVNNGTRLIKVTDFGNSNKADNVYYVDQFGYVVKSTAAAASTDYGYVVDIYLKTSTTIDGTTPAMEARVVLADGTVKVYDVKLEKLSSARGDCQVGDWVVKGLTNGGNPVLAYDKSGDWDNEELNDWYVANIKNNVYGYTLSDNTITFEELSGVLAEDSTTLLTGATIAEDATSTTVGGKNVLLSKDVAIVVYDDDDQVAKVYNGTANIGTAGLTGCQTVVTGESTTLGTAEIVFATKTGGVALEADNYVFIDKTEFTTDLDANDKTTYVYTAADKNGEVVQMTADEALTKTGLYKYTSENTVEDGDCLKEAGPGLNGFANTYYGYGRLHVSGDMMWYDAVTGTYYDISGAAVIYVDDDLNEVDGNVGLFVLNEDNNNLVDTIYIIA